MSLLKSPKKRSSFRTALAWLLAPSAPAIVALQATRCWDLVLESSGGPRDPSKGGPTLQMEAA